MGELLLGSPELTTGQDQAPCCSVEGGVLRTAAQGSSRPCLWGSSTYYTHTLGSRKQQVHSLLGVGGHAQSRTGSWPELTRLAASPAVPAFRSCGWTWALGHPQVPTQA